MTIDFRAGALATLGYFQHAETRPLDEEEIRSAVENPDLMEGLTRAIRSGTVRLLLDPDRLASLRLDPEIIGDLEETWREALVESYLPDGQVRIELEGTSPEKSPALAEFFEAAPWRKSTVVVSRATHGPWLWHWPLRIGVTLGSASTRFREALDEYPHPGLVHVVDMDAPDETCDLMLLSQSDQIFANRESSFRAGFVVLFVPQPSDVGATLLRLVAEHVDSAAAAIMVEPPDFTGFLQDFLDGLAHDLTPDVALSNANWQRQDLLVFADPAFLHSARVTSSIAHVQAEIETAKIEGRIDDEEFRKTLRELKYLDYRLSEKGFDAERYGATAAADATKQLEPTLDEVRRTAAKQPAEDRYLQAQVYHMGKHGLEQRRMSFQSGGHHVIEFRIGPTNLDWIQLDSAFPDHLLPPNEPRHVLAVMLVAPRLFDDPVCEKIELPAKGTSSIARFCFEVPDDLEEIDAKVIVLHQTDILQIGNIWGPVTSSEDHHRATGIVFNKGPFRDVELDFGVMPDLTFQKDGAQLLLTRLGHSDRTPSLGGIDQRVNKIREALFDAARGVYQLEAGLAGGPGLGLLRMLAAQGEFIRRQLFGVDRLEDVRRVQVVSPYSADFFPVEYLYDYSPPNPDAELCPHFAKIDDAAAGCNDCSAKNNGAFVCPLGFWGLNRVIERLVIPQDLAGEKAPEPKSGHDMLPRFTGVVFAASSKVDTPTNSHEVQDTLEALLGITGNRAFMATSWAHWQELSENHQPVLLVALPHNVNTQLGFEALQIAEDEELLLNQVGIHIKPPRESVVILLGCNTAAAKVDYEDFVAGLQSAGAAVVVGTVTSVLGMQAAPMAREFVRQFWPQAGSNARKIGDVFRSVRIRMVQAGNPLALAMAAYGDADWRLAPR